MHEGRIFLGRKSGLLYEANRVFPQGEPIFFLLGHLKFCRFPTKIYYDVRLYLYAIILYFKLLYVNIVLY